MIDNNLNDTEPNEAKAYKSNLILNKTLIITLIVALFASSAIPYYFSVKHIEKTIKHENQLSSLKWLEGNTNIYKELYEEQKKEHDELKYQADFMDNEIAIINEGERVYHKYDCTLVRKKSFYALELRNAQEYGNTPCGLCHKE